MSLICIIVLVLIAATGALILVEPLTGVRLSDGVYTAAAVILILAICFAVMTLR